MIDDADKIKMLIDPQSDYAQSAAWALGRSMDDEIIAAASGNAFGGEEGGTTVSLPNAQKLVATDGISVVGTNLNVKTLRETKKVFDTADVDESITRYFAITASQLQSLLSETETTSADFNSVRALVQGELNTFMGFEFIRIQRLARPTANLTFAPVNGSVGAGSGTLVASTARSCLAWAQDGLLLALGQDIRGRIAERADKSFSMQVFASMGIGATRMEEVKLVEVNCKE